MASDLIQPLCQIMNWMWEPITIRIGYARNLKKNFEELSKKVAKLCHTRDDIKDKIDRVKQQKTPTRQCMDWLTEVDTVEGNMKLIEQEYNADRRCIKGWFPDLFASIKLGKRVVEMIKCVEDLQKKKITSEGDFLADRGPSIVEKMPTPSLVALTSADHTLQEILTHIKNKETKMIGVSGIGGVGKTTIMKLLNKNHEIKRIFDRVIWVTVSNSWDLKRLQHDVAQRLSVDIKDESEDGAASKLYNQLEGKKYLLLLDDIWEPVDLSKIGIPNADEENGCKVVLTTRELDVCRFMETDVDIRVKTLSEEEAWNIFYSKVGEVAMFPTIKPLAGAIVRECGGLPLALIMTGASLRREEDVNVWRNFLRELQSPTTSNIKAMEEKVFKPLKISYDHLKDSNIQNCFLYCGLYPEDYEIKISELIDYWRAEGLLLSEGTLTESEDKGHAVVRELKDASLLERGEKDGYVKLHDVIRDLVLRMTSIGEGECRHLVRAGLSREARPQDKEWEDVVRISFIDNKLETLPEMPNCPRLATLLLQRNNEIVKIPKTFFNYMPSLRVLDLSETTIKYLPAFISNLVSLRALFLRSCGALKEIRPEVSVLEKLEVIRATRTKITFLPNEIWKITSLKCVRFDSIPLDSRQKMVIPRGMISKLSQLEIFRISQEICRMLSDESVEVITKEVCTLEALQSNSTFEERIIFDISLRTANHGEIKD